VPHITSLLLDRRHSATLSVPEQATCGKGTGFVGQHVSPADEKPFPSQAAIAARAAALSAPAWLFVDILNAYATHHAAGNPNITPGVLQVRARNPPCSVCSSVSVAPAVSVAQPNTQLCAGHATLLPSRAPPK
jgi:hypothetical protein